MLKNLIIVVQLIILCHISPALAVDSDKTDQEDSSQDTASDDDKAPAEEKAPARTTVTSMDAYSGEGEQTAISLQLAAKYAANQGDYDKAIKLCKLSAEKRL